MLRGAVNISSVCFFLLTLSLLYVCYTDIRYRIISNRTTLSIGLLSILTGYLSVNAFSVLPALLIITIGFFLSCKGFFGAGDVKLMAALSLSLDVDASIKFIYLTGLAGLPLVLIIMLASYFSKKGKKDDKTQNVPYGIAIVSGYLATLLLFGRGI